MGKFKNKIILITGASRGLGAALSHSFAREGATLILMAKRIDGLERLDAELDQYNVKTTLVPLDFQKPERLETLPQALGEKFGHLDVLIGNAAVLSQLSPVTHFSPREFQKVMDVNVTANWHLMAGLECLLKKSQAPRAIFVTAGSANESVPFWGPYAASKAALEKLVQTYAAEMKKTPLKINLVDPGTMATDLLKQALPGLDAEAVPAPQDQTDVFMYLASDSCQESGHIFKSADFIAPLEQVLQSA